MQGISSVTFRLAALAVFVMAFLAGPATAEPKRTTSVVIPRATIIQQLSSTRFSFRAAGGTTTGTYNCSCTGKGACSVEQMNGVLKCGKTGDTCDATCEMSTVTNPKAAIQ